MEPLTLRERSEPSAAEPPHTRWCRACGAVPRRGSDDAGDGSCGPCGTPLDPPEPGPARIGRVVLVGNRLLPRHAVSVAEEDDVVLVLDRTDTPVAVPLDR